MSQGSPSGDRDEANQADSTGDPMLSIRPSLPVSPSAHAATVRLDRGSEARGDSSVEPGSSEDGPTLDPSRTPRPLADAHSTRDSGTYLIPVTEPEGPEGQPQPGIEAAYELLSPIGEGGMGEVWEARQRSLGRLVAFKRVRKGKKKAAALVRQFESEARLTGVLDHPNIVTVHELGRDQSGRIFYTMKLIRGTPWVEVIASGKRKTSEGEEVELELRDHLEILGEVCNAVAFAHSRGVIHRDIKPGNVMIGDYGEVLLVDWGLALALRPLERLDGAETWTLATLPRSALVCGTPAYMPPETAGAARERIGFSTDVYLLGAVLYHILYRKPPHKGRSVKEVMTRAKANAWSFPTKVPRKLEPWDALLRPVINRALATDPDARFADATAFGEALREAMRNYDSARVATRARAKLEQMQEEGPTPGGYQRLAALIARLEGALDSWPQNLIAHESLARAHLQLASLALANDDLNLAQISVAAYQKMPPLPEPELPPRRLTLHPVDGTLVGAPRPTESLLAVASSREWGSSRSHPRKSSASELSRSDARVSAGARTVGTENLVRQRAVEGRGEATLDSGEKAAISTSAAASVAIEKITGPDLLNEHEQLEVEARRLQAEINERDRRARSRRLLLRSAGGLALGLTLITLVSVSFAARAVREQRDRAERDRDHFSQLLLEEAASTTEAQLGGLFDPVHGALMSAVAWGRAGRLDSEDPAQLNVLFMPLLEGVPAATSTLRADAAGHEYMLLRREEGGWQTRSTHPGKTHELGSWDEQGRFLAGTREDLDYDPHLRPWYRGGAALHGEAVRAREAGEPHPVHWTTPYTFFTTRDPGISVSAPVTSASGLELVLAFDVKLADISEFTRTLPEGERGQVFVLDENMRVLGLPKETSTLASERRSQLVLTPMAELDEAPISRRAFQAWMDEDQPDQPFRVALGTRGDFWVSVRRLDGPSRPQLWIGVVVPESRLSEG